MNTLYPPSPANNDALSNSNIENILPDDVKRKIYNEYFLGQDLCNRYYNTVKSIECQRLEYRVLLPVIIETLKHPCVIDELSRNTTTGYGYYYKEHYVKKEKSFKLLNTEESFTLCILMSLYH